jgi:hypothetical protein
VRDSQGGDLETIGTIDWQRGAAAVIQGAPLQPREVTAPVEIATQVTKGPLARSEQTAEEALQRREVVPCVGSC